MRRLSTRWGKPSPPTGGKSGAQPALHARPASHKTVTDPSAETRIKVSANRVPVRLFVA